jgi:two-component system, chemotaxis family, sensor kinase CheA
MALDLTKFLLRFVEEAREHLGKMSDGIASLAQGGADADLIHALFRSAHTIKGSARMMKLIGISETAHKMEDVLGALRDGKISFNREIGQLLYRTVDALSRMVDGVAEKPSAPDLPLSDGDLRRDLANVLKLAVPSEPKEPPSDGRKEALPDPVVIQEGPSVSSSGGAEPRMKMSETVRLRLEKLDELIKLMGEMVSSSARMRQRLLDLGDVEHAMDVGGRSGKDLEGLHRFRRDLTDDVQAQELLLDDLHDKVLSMRMLPLSIIFDTVGRAVREMARSQGKQAECIIRGSEIELDRQMIDRLSDPLVHILRNAVDHGLEAPDRRMAAGKEAVGRVFLSARQENGQVVIEIEDDGAGIDLSAVRRKAVARGIMTESEAGDISREKLLDMIFLPGFSTSAGITDISGRGVGLDVVKRSIADQLHGVVSVETRPGRGAVFSLRLPLSLAVMRILIVEANGCPFGFAARNVTALRRIPAGSLISVAGNQNAVVLENEFIPVSSLAGLVGAPSRPVRRAGSRRAANEGGSLLVIVQDRMEKLALIVDRLVDEHDMVVKPLPGHLSRLPLVSGVVMTGKEELVCILHTPALLDRSRRLHRAAHTDGRTTSGTSETIKKKRILVVDDSLTTREVVRDLLEAYHYQVLLAEDGQDGLDKALADDFAAVLTDVEMPNMDGFTLTKRLRAEDRYRHVPIMMITSREREEDKRRGMEAGADAYIVKSGLNQSSLMDTLQTILG